MQPPLSVFNDGQSGITGIKRSAIIDAGIIMRHRIGKWNIGHSIKNKNAKEISGCSDGPIEIDFKRKLVWSC